MIRQNKGKTIIKSMIFVLTQVQLPSILSEYRISINPIQITRHIATFTNHGYQERTTVRQTMQSKAQEN